MEVGLGIRDIQTSEVTISNMFELCISQGFGCALYRLPQTDNKHFIMDLNGGKTVDTIQLEQMDSGYIIHPFSRENHPVKFIERHIHLVETMEGNDTAVLKSMISEDELISQVRDLEKSSKIQSTLVSGTQHLKASNAEEQFKNLVQKAIEAIHSAQFEKVVLAREKKIILPDGFEPVRFFNALCNKYRNAFVHLTFTPDSGMWLGATPELLIQIDRENRFQTVALAATQLYNPEVAPEETTWSQKDIEEQALVSRYIINCFKQIRLREFEEIGPRTYLSGNLVHLKTNFFVNINQTGFTGLGSVMLELLHPTSAVCGMPKHASKTFIDENEDFDRGYFSGFVGPVNISAETNLFVNLRCMQIEQHSARLFAGAGIIANSNPQKEWSETEIKMDTLLSVLKA